MGWKTIKEHYRIPDTFIVYRQDRAHYIGSQKTIALIKIEDDGSCHWCSIRPSGDPELQEIHAAMNRDPKLLRRLASMPDQFEKTVAVYCLGFEPGEVLTRYCEQPGWPNVTHDGMLMSPNTYTTDRQVAIGWVVDELERTIEVQELKIKELGKARRAANKVLRHARAELARAEQARLLTIGD